jgi:hypothetical protein
VSEAQFSVALAGLNEGTYAALNMGFEVSKHDGVKVTVAHEAARPLVSVFSLGLRGTVSNRPGLGYGLTRNHAQRFPKRQ